jgi:diacylglycerol kinase (ATP)
MSRRPILLLANPVAGGKPGAGPALSDDPADLEPARLAIALERLGLDVSLHELRDTDDPSALAAAAAKRGCDVVVAGGDGTVGQVATALLGSDAVLGILPTGSFNNVARALELPSRLEAAMQVIAEGRVDEVDVGAVRHADEEPRYFYEAAGVGIDAAGFVIGEALERRGLRRALRAAWRALRWRGRPMRLVLDDAGAIRTRALMVTVSNGPYYGLGFTLAADADPRDGRFEVSIFRRMNRLELVLHFAAVARGRRAYEPRIGRYAAQRVRIEGLRGAVPAHADGVALGVTPVTFEVMPRALRVFRRAGAAPDR